MKIMHDMLMILFVVMFLSTRMVKLFAAAIFSSSKVLKGKKKKEKLKTLCNGKMAEEQGKKSESSRQQVEESKETKKPELSDGMKEKMAELQKMKDFSAGSLLTALRPSPAGSHKIPQMVPKWFKIIPKIVPKMVPK